MKEQGYQSRLAAGRDLPRCHRRRSTRIAASAYAGKTFAALNAAQQDEVLHGVDKGDIKLTIPATTGQEFFDLLLQNTKEGFLSDPMYGGNRNFAGWRLIGFPGPRYNYANEITAYGKRYTMPYVGLLGRNGLLIQGT